MNACFLRVLADFVCNTNIESVSHFRKLFNHFNEINIDYHEYFQSSIKKYSSECLTVPSHSRGKNA